jgi:hypothetical protein
MLQSNINKELKMFPSYSQVKEFWTNYTANVQKFWEDFYKDLSKKN